MKALAYLYPNSTHDIKVGTLVLFNKDYRSWSENNNVSKTFHKFLQDKIYLKSYDKQKKFFTKELATYPQMQKSVLERLESTGVIEMKEIIELFIHVLHGDEVQSVDIECQHECRHDS